MPTLNADDPHTLSSFYEQAYTTTPEQSELYSRWRALGALGKADHVTGLCAHAELTPSAILDVGCGDGALLGELSRRGFGTTRTGLELSAAAVAIARSRPGVDRVEQFDGAHVPGAAGEYDLGILSHVLEHVPDPSALLAEVARASRAVVIEVPLEANVSAMRSSKRAHAEEIGHLRRLDRAGAHAIVAGAGLRVAGELDDPLPLEVHLFFARGTTGRARAYLKWATRAVLHRLSPPLARRLFTVHYAALCLPASPPPPAAATEPSP
ncbi:MAG TPA: class I SAM-dependent methyltransferase [Solirubrobacteraceae bacterium]|nr:class I SAM-dependent methyltransferase [Solirubrobacteraceae bacterium]